MNHAFKLAHAATGLGQHAVAMQQTNQPETTTASLSEILGQGALWAIENAARKFIKAREAVLKNKSASALDDRKQDARDAKAICEGLMYAFEMDFDPQSVIEAFIGLNREWTASPAKIADFANANDISHERARDALSATMARAQLSSIDNRAALFSLYEGWLSDIEPQEHKNDAVAEAVKRTVIQAYTKAGEWMRPDEALLIKGAADDLGVLLPTWESVLPSAAGIEKVRERIQAAVSNHAGHRAQMLIEASRAMDAQDW